MKYKIKKARRAKQRYISIYIALRNRAISANWSIVPSCIEYHNKRYYNKDPSRLMEIGHLNLLNAVDCFDPWLGFTFGTYAYSSILKGFISKPTGKRSVPATQINEVLTDTLTNKQDKNDDELLWIERLQKLLEIQNLNEREVDILTYRFGCYDYDGPKLRLEDVANIWGLTKERVRQIQVNTLVKLKRGLREDKVLH